MSMIQTKYCESFIRNNEMPKWMRDERYEYCEPAAMRMNRKNGLFYAIVSALAMLR